MVDLCLFRWVDTDGQRRICTRRPHGDRPPYTYAKRVHIEYPNGAEHDPMRNLMRNGKGAYSSKGPPLGMGRRCRNCGCAQLTHAIATYTARPGEPPENRRCRKCPDCPGLA